MSEFVGLHNGVPQKIADMRLGFSDLGLMQGAFIVDRLRTMNGFPLSPESHAKRFCDNVSRIGLNAPRTEQVIEWISDVCNRNQDTITSTDLSIVLLAAPASDVRNLAANFWLYPSFIDWKKLASYYQYGQRLHISSVCNIPNECWDTRIKNRSRLHYFLADQATFAATKDAFAAPVLLDMQGYVTETSTANIVIVEGDRITSPPLTSIFAGLALQRNLQIWKELNVVVNFEPITEQRLHNADSIILSNSTGFAWNASQIGDRIMPAQDDKSVIRALQNQLTEMYAFNFIDQAIRLASTASMKS